MGVRPWREQVPAQDADLRCRRRMSTVTTRVVAAVTLQVVPEARDRGCGQAAAQATAAQLQVPREVRVGVNSRVPGLASTRRLVGCVVGGMMVWMTRAGTARPRHTAGESTTTVALLRVLRQTDVRTLRAPCPATSRSCDMTALDRRFSS